MPLEGSDEPVRKRVRVRGLPCFIYGLATSDFHQLLKDWLPKSSDERRWVVQPWDRAKGVLRSLLISHALNISSDVIKAPEIKCLSQTKQAGSGVHFGQDCGKRTRCEGGGRECLGLSTCTRG